MLRAYYVRLLVRAVWGPLQVFSLLATAIGVLGAALIYRVPEWGPVVSFYVWVVPLAVFVATVALGLILAPYCLHREDKRASSARAEALEGERDAVRAEVQALRGRRAVLECAGVEPSGNRWRVRVVNRGAMATPVKAWLDRVEPNDLVEPTLPRALRWDQEVLNVSLAHDEARFVEVLRWRPDRRVRRAGVRVWFLGTIGREYEVAARPGVDYCVNLRVQEPEGAIHESLRLRLDGNSVTLSRWADPEGQRSP